MFFAAARPNIEFQAECSLIFLGKQFKKREKHLIDDYVSLRGRIIRVGSDRPLGTPAAMCRNKEASNDGDDDDEVLDCKRLTSRKENTVINFSVFV